MHRTTKNALSLLAVMSRKKNLYNCIIISSSISSDLRTLNLFFQFPSTKEKKKHLFKLP